MRFDRPSSTRRPLPTTPSEGVPRKPKAIEYNHVLYHIRGASTDLISDMILEFSQGMDIIVKATVCFQSIFVSGWLTESQESRLTDFINRFVSITVDKSIGECDEAES